jgi:CDP-diacylglycerol--serine O-phosphatidyltransferase
LAGEDIEILNSAKQYHQRLISLIEQAKSRIYITVLYLQDDEAGREVLSALHKASLANPSLEVNVLVDFHRAQRGLIGAAKSEGNAALYCNELEKYQSNVKIYGVPVKGKELFGVLHLKGIVIDDTLLYSGASINDVYMNVGEKYRLDRYFILQQPGLADSFCDFTNDFLLSSEAVPRIDTRPVTTYNDIKAPQRQLMKELKKGRYNIEANNTYSTLNVRPFLGFGRRTNKLNRLIKTLFDTTENELLLYTPYFNFPAPLLRSLRRLLKQNKEVTIVVGDKTANDFYISPEQPF